MIELFLAFGFAAAFFRRANLADRRPYIWAAIGAAIFLASSQLFSVVGYISSLLGGLDLFAELVGSAIGMILGASFTRWVMQRVFQPLYAGTSQSAFRLALSKPATKPSVVDRQGGDHDRGNWFSRISKAFPDVQTRKAPRLSDQALRRLEIVTSLLAYAALFSLAIYAAGASAIWILSWTFGIGIIIYSFGIPPWRLVEFLYLPFRNRARQCDIDSAALADGRRPVLLLRSFSTENEKISTEDQDVRAADASAALGKRFEQLLVDQFRKFLGPVVCIGNPADRAIVSGASRLYAGTEDWTKLVAALMEESQLIVLQLSPTIRPARSLNVNGTRVSVPSSVEYKFSDGFIYELSLIANNGHTMKTAIVNLDRNGALIPPEQYRAMVASMPREMLECYGSIDASYRIFSPAIGSFGGESAMGGPQDEVENAIALMAWRWHKANNVAMANDSNRSCADAVLPS